MKKTTKEIIDFIEVWSEENTKTEDTIESLDLCEDTITRVRTTLLKEKCKLIEDLEKFLEEEE